MLSGDNRITLIWLYPLINLLWSDYRITLIRSVVVIYFQTTLNDGHLFSNDFVLQFIVKVVYFQINSNFDGCLFSKDIVLWFDIVTIYFQKISNCDDHFFQTNVLLWSNVVTVYFQTISDNFSFIQCVGCLFSNDFEQLWM